MATYSIQTTQFIPVGIETAWSFFSNPVNLQAITPSELNFVVTSKSMGEKMYPGQIIEYRLRPLFHIPIYWMTEISHVIDPFFFVDEQRFGPYAFWHHQHQFREVEGGVEMTDLVHYRIPFWILGDFVHALFVRKKLQDIFRYRFQKVEEIFGKWPGKPSLEPESIHRGKIA